MALDLPAEERGELAASLFNSLELPDPGETGIDSLSEAAQRSAELDSGEVEAIPESEFWKLVQDDRQR